MWGRVGPGGAVWGRLGPWAAGCGTLCGLCWARAGAHALPPGPLPPFTPLSLRVRVHTKSLYRLSPESRAHLPGVTESMCYTKY